MVGENNWFATESGQRLAADAAHRSEPWLSHFAGHNALVLQPCTQGLVIPKLQCQPLIRLERANRRFYGDFHAEDCNLPLASDCLALIFAMFVLESSPQPDQLIDEFERMLLAEGHLALLTLNPNSPSRLTGKWRGLGLKSATDWINCLNNAGFELLRHERIGEIYRPRGLRSVNFLLARKRRLTFTTIRKHTNAVSLVREPSAS
jgi:SAM-dependent methyltransferase